MSDPKFPPLMIAPIKKKTVVEVVWEAVGGWVLFIGGCVVGWICRGMG